MAFCLDLSRRFCAKADPRSRCISAKTERHKVVMKPFKHQEKWVLELMFMSIISKDLCYDFILDELYKAKRVYGFIYFGS